MIFEIDKETDEGETDDDHDDPGYPSPFGGDADLVAFDDQDDRMVRVVDGGSEKDSPDDGSHLDVIEMVVFDDLEVVRCEVENGERRSSQNLMYLDVGEADARRET